MIPKVKISDPEAVRERVEKLPEGRQNTDWYWERIKALEVLSPDQEK